MLRWGTLKEHIGYCYSNGIGIKKDEHKALIYYQKSAEMVSLKEYVMLDYVIETELE
jgi:hypothetical protein